METGSMRITTAHAPSVLELDWRRYSWPYALTHFAPGAGKRSNPLGASSPRCSRSVVLSVASLATRWQRSTELPPPAQRATCQPITADHPASAKNGSGYCHDRRPIGIHSLTRFYMYG